MHLGVHQKRMELLRHVNGSQLEQDIVPVHIPVEKGGTDT